MVRDVAVLRDRASKVDQKLATMILETEVSFESPAAFKAFSEELAAQLARLTTLGYRGGGVRRVKESDRYVRRR
jgi:hypothetical protein